MGDALAIQIQILSLIPPLPEKISAAEIENSLRAMNYHITRRTIERHLNDMGPKRGFGIVRDNSKPAGWSWKTDTKPFRFPGIGMNTALTMSLVGRYLTPILPLDVAKLLEEEFRQAHAMLDALPGAQLSRWSHRTCAIHSWFRLLPPVVEEGVRNIAFEALLKGVQFEADYRALEADVPSRHRFHPLGLMFRDDTLYLVATAGEHVDPRQFALHRMRSPILLKAAAIEPPGFDFERYMREEGNHELNPSKPIRLQLRVKPWLARHLSERRLSDDQSIVPIAATEDSRVVGLLADSMPMRWWLLSLGSSVEVQKPLALRKWITRELTAARGNYRAGKSKNARRKSTTRE